MMSPAAGFYSTPEMGINQVRWAYVFNKKDIQRAFFIGKGFRAVSLFKSVRIKGKNNMSISKNKYKNSNFAIRNINEPIFKGCLILIDYLIFTAI